MRYTILWILAGFLLTTVAVSLTVGRYPVPFSDITAILLHNVLPGQLETPAAIPERVVEVVRLPRILLAALAGAGLGTAGAALQSLFRNPLVAPDILGIAPGAAFGGALAIMLSLGAFATVVTAFLFGLLAIILVSFVAALNGRTTTLPLVLAGVIAGALFSALISLLTFLADVESELPAIMYWLLGSFSSANNSKLLLVLLSTVPATALLFLMSYRLNTLSVGEEEAAALGVAVARVRWITLCAVAVIVAGGVAVAGVIGWVGLVVPHLARPLVGPDNRYLLPAAALIGAAFLVAVDTVCRSLTAAEIPLSVITAIVGAPVFMFLLRRTGALGWARA